MKRICLAFCVVALFGANLAQAKDLALKFLGTPTANSSVPANRNVSAIGVTPTLASVIITGSDGHFSGRLNVML